MPTSLISLRVVSVFVLVIFCLTGISLGQTTVYTITDIAPGTISNPNASYFPQKINDNGYITGFASFGAGSFISRYWIGGFEYPAGGNNSVAYDISNANIIVGRGSFSGVGIRAYTYSSSSQNIHQLPCPVFSQAGAFCEAYSVSNSNGVIVGTSDPRYLYPQGHPAGAVSRALFWDSFGAHEIFPGSNSVSIANDINNVGTVAGMFGYQPFIRNSSGTVTLLGGYSNTGSVGEMVFATAINDSGHAVGGHTLNLEGLVQRAFFWNGGSPVDIGNLGIATIPSGQSRPVVAANDINNADQVVGNAAVGFDTNGLLVTHAFVWDPQNGMIDLNNLIPQESGIVLTEATGINNAGDIVAVGYVNGNNPYIRRAFLLKTSHKTPLIFIPGISGSTLYEADANGDPIVHTSPDPRISAIWPNGLFAPALLGLSKLYLDPNAEPPDFGILAVDAVDQVTSYAPIYKPLLDNLTTNGYVKYQTGLNPKKRFVGDGPQYCDGTERYDGRKPDLFVFAYDWRKTNVDAAAQLSDFIECVQLFHPDQKVDILTHSMGGLVARRYLLDNKNDHNVDKLITTVAPFLGAPKAIDVLHSGRFIPVFGDYYYRRNVIRRVASYSKGVHELLPSEWYYELGERPFANKSLFLGLTSDYSYNDTKMVLNRKFSSRPYSTGEAFHGYPFNARLQDNWSLDNSDVKFYHLYGVQAYDKTPGKIVEYPYGGLTLEQRRFGTEIRYTDGDGTVPAISASRARPGIQSVLTGPNTVTKRCKSPGYFSDKHYEHVSILANDIFLNEIRAILNNSYINQDECKIEGSSQSKNSEENGAKNQRVINTVPATSIFIYGVQRLEISDHSGNTNIPVGDGVDMAVPDIDYEYGSEISDPVIIPHEVNFAAGKGVDIKFVTPTGKIRIELFQGTSRDVNTGAIKYIDLELPAGVTAWLKFNPVGEPPPPPTLGARSISQQHSLIEEVENLRYDGDGDGNFETVVQPTFVLSGSTANDITPPTINISHTVTGGEATFTVTATDSESGVSEIRYIVDGETSDHIYSAPFIVNATQSHLILVSAEDNAGNKGFLGKWLDTTSPTTNAEQLPLPNSEGWNNSDVMLNLKALDDIGGSGVDTLTYEGNGAQIFPEEILTKFYDPAAFPVRSKTVDFFEKSIEITAEGITNFNFRSKDRTGNTEPIRSHTVKIDKGLPVASHSLTTNGNETILTLTAIDAISGIKEILYAIDGGSYQPYTEPVVIFNHVTYFAKDFAGNESPLRTAYAGPRTTWADFDGDGITDVSVFRPNDSNWYVSRSSDGGYQIITWGLNTDKLTPGDFDGDGKTDHAVFRSSNSTWYILQSSNNTLAAFQWGVATDIPVGGDYDGDGKTDVAVWRPSEGNWYVRQSFDETSLIVNFGQAGDVPLIGDFDGDRKADIAFFRLETGTWNIQRSSGGTIIKPFGLADDKLVPADFDGDGTTDFGVWRPSTGFWYFASSYEDAPGQNFTAIPYGQSGDVPVPGDFDGDGKYDIAVYRSGTWYILNLKLGSTAIVSFGLGGDKPIPSAYLP